MFTDILKILPKLDEKDLKAMEKALSSRFSKLAKSFGKGIANSFKGAGFLGAGLTLIDKLLNPLKEVQEAMDATLQKSDDIVTNAKQFNTSSGNLVKLITLAKATGLDQESLFMLINKFQGAVAQQKANPNDPNTNSVKNFVNNTDTAAAFFEFIQSLQKLDKNSQILVQQQVFGEKQILKMADFLQSDFSKVAKSTGVDRTSTAQLTKAAEHNGNLNDLKDELKAGQDMTDLIAKSKVITEQMIRDKAAAEQRALDIQNKQISSYENLAAIEKASNEIQVLIQEGVGLIGRIVKEVIPGVTKIAQAAERMLASPFLRGIMKRFGGGKDE